MAKLPCQRECSNPHICKFIPFKCEAKCSEQVLVRIALLLGLMQVKALHYNADVDECEVDDLNNCHESAQCTNTVGSYTCSCNPGYTGDGVNCTSKLIMERDYIKYPLGCTETL